MPGVRSSNPASGCARSSSSSACTWKRSTRSSTGAPNSTSRLLSPDAANAQRRVVRRGRQFEQRRTDCRRAAAGCGTRLEAKSVARAKLPDLPQLVVDDGDRANEAAEARAVGPEDHRHVAGEVDAADGVGVVVDVGRMQSRLAAVVARPRGLRPDQSHAGAAGVVVHFPFGVEERAHVFGREEIRRAMRAVGDADLPGMCSSSGVRRAAMAWQPSRPRPLAVSRSTSPARSARPPWPPNCPSVNVERLPRYSGMSKLPRTAR